MTLAADITHIASSVAMSKRPKLSLKAKLSRLLDRAEDPAEMLDYSYAVHVEQLYGMRRDIADLATAKMRLARLRDSKQARFLKLHSSARAALELGREDLARQALERKRLIGQELVGLNQQVAELEHQQVQMIARGREARAGLERFRARKELTKARYAAARAQLAISDSVAGFSARLRDLGLRIERTNHEVEEMNLQADVREELERTGVLTPIGASEDDVDRQLRQLSSRESVDDELSRMRRELNRVKPGSPPI
jgi:phage shock protein A